MLVGRDDGYVEVFTLSDFEDPKLVFSFCANESVTAVRGQFSTSVASQAKLCC